MMWPKGPTMWIEGRTLKVSIPFTWSLPEVKSKLWLGDLFWDNAVVGGPAVQLMPGFFDSLPNVTEGEEEPTALSRINPFATRTTIGCPRRCRFCAIGTRKVEPEFRELNDWELKPVVMDNNLFAASEAHVVGVLERLRDLGGVDFNQGVDARLLTADYADLIKQIKRPVIRLALDHKRDCDAWGRAFDILRSAGIAKKNIRSYALVGFDADPSEAWDRCEWIESHGIKALPMWFHSLDCLNANEVTEDQVQLGWSDYERRKIMQWFYQHKEAVKR